MLELAELVRPKIVAAGHFLIGLDIVGDKMAEINPISTGGAQHYIGTGGRAVSAGRSSRRWSARWKYVGREGPPFDSRVVATME